MKILFKNTLYFSVLYLLLYLVDSYFKNNEHLFTYRYLSKTLLSTSLLIFYVVNTNQRNIIKRRLVIGALSFFVFGDILFISGNSGHTLHFVIAALLFIVAKVLYSIRFLNNKDFNIVKLAPFLLFCFLYMSVIMYVVYNNLGDFFMPLLLYLFVVMMLMQFAYLRKNEVVPKSFWLVIIGVILSMVADSINILKIFYDSEIAYNKITVMLFYALSQYLIVLGILNEVSEKGTKDTSTIQI